MIRVSGLVKLSPCQDHHEPMKRHAVPGPESGELASPNLPQGSRLRSVRAHFGGRLGTLRRPVFLLSVVAESLALGFTAEPRWPDEPVPAVGHGHPYDALTNRSQNVSWQRCDGLPNVVARWVNPPGPNRLPSDSVWHPRSAPAADRRRDSWRSSQTMSPDPFDLAQ